MNLSMQLQSKDRRMNGRPSIRFNVTVWARLSALLRDSQILRDSEDFKESIQSRIELSRVVDRSLVAAIVLWFCLFSSSIVTQRQNEN